MELLLQILFSHKNLFTIRYIIYIYWQAARNR